MDFDDLMKKDPRTGNYTMTVDDVDRMFRMLEEIDPIVVPFVFDPMDTDLYYPDPADR